jgi:hypothetical protein
MKETTGKNLVVEWPTGIAGARGVPTALENKMDSMASCYSGIVRGREAWRPGDTGLWRA